MTRVTRLLAAGAAMKMGGEMRGWPLTLARAAWLAIAALTIGIFIAAVPLRYAQLQAACAAARCADAVTLAPLTPSLYPGGLVALDVVSALVWCAVAAALFWRRSSDPVALFCAFTLLLFGAARFPDTPLTLAAASPGWWAPVAALRYTGSACLSIFCYVFPDGRFVPRWTALAVVAWIGAQVPEFFLPQSAVSATQMSPLLAFGAFGAFVGSVLVAQGYRYWRVSRPAQRQQTKWVALGLAAALISYLALTFALPLLVAPTQRSAALAQAGVTVASIVAMLLVPITLGIAILRYRLFDIDRLINQALVYGALTATLAAVNAACIIAIQAIAQAVTGRGEIPPLAIVASTLLLAALFQPLHRRIQIAIDRRFYRRKYDAARTLTRFSAALRQELDLGQLSEQLVAVVERTMHPAHISIWLAPPRAPDAREARDDG